MKVTLGILVAMLAASSPALAHHSFAAEFDAAKCSDITGVLTKVAYENPHSYVWVDVKNAAGKVESMLGKRDVAAFIMEPISINLGVVIPDGEFVRRVRAACTRADRDDSSTPAASRHRRSNSRNAAARKRVWRTSRSAPRS